jgi:hypothetical protein
MRGESWIWDELAIAETGDQGEIRRAYARALRAIDPEADPNAFIALRQARDAALAFAAAQGAGETGPGLANPPWRVASPPPPETIPSPVDRRVPEAVPEPSVFRRRAEDSEPAAEPDLDAPEVEPPVFRRLVEAVPPSPSPPQAEAPEPLLPPADPGSAGPREPPVFRRTAAETIGPAAEEEPPTLDAALLERIDALLFGGGEPDPGTLAALTEQVLADPAAERIDVLRWLEGWMGDRIVRGTPRSDPMIEPAIVHFRWDASQAEIGRAPVPDWILQRRTDHGFEAELATSRTAYGRLFRELRAGGEARPGRLAAWRKGPKVEYLLAYLHSRHPTVADGLDPAMLAWWDKTIEGQRGKGPIGSLRESRRIRVWEHGLKGLKRKVGLGLGAGLLLYPYVFAWVLLRRGHSATARILGFGWLVASLVLILALPTPSPPHGGTPHYRIAPSYKPIPAYVYADDDLDPILLYMSGGAIGGPELQQSRPALYDRLVDHWREAASVREQADKLVEDVAQMVDWAFVQSLRLGGPELQLEYWRLFAAQARWAGGESPALCDQLLDPAYRFSARLRPDLKTRLWVFERRVLLEPAPQPSLEPSGPEQGAFPPDVLAEARRLSRLRAATFAAALRDGSGPEERCKARTALVETVLGRSGRERALLLRQLTARL